MREKMRVKIYSLRRFIHFTSGFIVRCAGEIGVLLFIILLGLLIVLAASGKDWLQYLIGLIAAFAAYTAFVTQQRGRMHDILKSLDNDFAELIPLRKSFSQKLQKKKSVCWPVNDNSVENILDFFDTVGFLIRTGALSFTVADEAYAYWSIRYFLICKERILWGQREDELRYRSYEWFVTRIAIKGNTDKANLRQFIIDEAEP